MCLSLVKDVNRVVVRRERSIFLIVSKVSVEHLSLPRAFEEVEQLMELSCRKSEPEMLLDPTKGGHSPPSPDNRGNNRCVALAGLQHAYANQAGLKLSEIHLLPVLRLIVCVSHQGSDNFLRSISKMLKM